MISNYMSNPPSTIPKSNNDIGIIGKNKVTFITSDNTNLTLPTSGTVATEEGGGGGGGGSSVYGSYILSVDDITIPPGDNASGIWSVRYQSDGISMQEDGSVNVPRGVYLVSINIDMGSSDDITILISGNGTQTDPNLSTPIVTINSSQATALLDFTGSEQEQDSINVTIFNNSGEDALIIYRDYSSFTIVKIA